MRPVPSEHTDLRRAPLAPGRVRETGLDVAEITEPAALEELRPEWSALHAQSPQATPFQSPEWLIAWRRHFVDRGLWVLAVRRARGLIGLAPFYIHRDPRQGERQITLLGNGISDTLDLLALPGEAAAVSRAVFGHLYRRAALWDSCDFRDLPSQSGLKAAGFPGARSDVIEAEEPCPAMGLPDAPQDVPDLLPRKRRDDLRRCARRASEAGTLTFETADPVSRIAFLAALMQLHARRWQSRGEAGVLAERRVQLFHREVTAALLERGMLRLHLLRLDGRAIAAQYALQDRQRAYSYLTTFDPDYAPLSPGLLLTAFTLEQAVRDGAKLFDFLRGRESYKYLWGAADRPQFRRRIRR